MTETAYAKIKHKMALNAQISHIKKVLNWDMAVNMPPGVQKARAHDLATLTALIQDGLAGSDMKQWLEEAADQELDEWDRRNLELIIERHRYARLLPTELARLRAEKKNQCFAEYKHARELNSWKHIEPYLEQSVEAMVTCAKIASDQMGVAPYDYQLQAYCGSNTLEVLGPLFRLLKHELPPLIQEIQRVQKPLQILPLQIEADQQMRAAERALAAMGFDFNYGYLARSHVAVSVGWRQDTRIATRYVPGTVKTVFSAIHEAGHAIYKQNLPAEWEGQPVGSDDDKMIHESQALFYEKQLGFSAEGLTFIHSLLAEADPVFGRAYAPQEFIARMHHVTPNLVRVHSDEVHYPMHILLRYEIERDLFDETITVRDIPEVWRAKSKEYFGMEPEDDLSGCLQDVHWFKGKFGYFPIYAQGAIIAAQLFATARRELPHAQENVAKGEIMPLTHWLTDRIHRWGQFYEPLQLIERATGSRVEPGFLLDHFRQRYLTQL